MITVLVFAVLAVLAFVGWLAFWCAEDKIADLTIELANERAASADLADENRRLRRHLARSSQHPAAIAARARAVGEPLFADTLAAIQALPETTPTLELRLNETDETVEFGGPL